MKTKHVPVIISAVNIDVYVRSVVIVSGVVVPTVNIFSKYREERLIIFWETGLSARTGTTKLTADCPDLLALDNRVVSGDGCVVSMTVDGEGVGVSSGVLLCDVDLAVAAGVADQTTEASSRNFSQESYA